jgi:hypothetical protein
MTAPMNAVVLWAFFFEWLLPITMSYDSVQRLVKTFQRYETAIGLRLSLCTG